MKENPVFNIDKLFLKVFGCRADSLAKKVILAPFISPHKFKLHFKREHIKGFSGQLYKGFTVVGSDESITVIHSGIGGQLVSDALLFLKRAGAGKVVFLGTAGGLGDIRIGDLLFVNQAASGPNFNKYVLPDKDYFQKLKGAFNGINKTFHRPRREGGIFTLSSLFEETSFFLEQLTKSGFKAVDLELFHFYQAARSSGIKAAGLCLISDRPLNKPLGELNKNEKKLLLDSLDSSIPRILSFLLNDE